MTRWTLHHGDCVAVLPTLPDASIDAVITDPLYPEIDREYGRVTEAEWQAVMRDVVVQTRRILKPSGSAVFILQPNSETVGRMRPWLWEFMAWAAREWNQVQDFWWWNPAAPPTVHTHRDRGLLRPSVKACVWLGPSDCYRNQEAVLWTQSAANAAVAREDRALRRHPSGLTIRPGRAAQAAVDRGGVTPFNLLPVANTNSSDSAGAVEHGAGTPLELAQWWCRYIVPTGGIVGDWFAGSGTIGIAALGYGLSYVGVERFDRYVPTARQRLAAAETQQVLPLTGAA